MFSISATGGIHSVIYAITHSQMEGGTPPLDNYTGLHLILDVELTA